MNGEGANNGRAGWGWNVEAGEAVAGRGSSREGIDQAGRQRRSEGMAFNVE